MSRRATLARLAALALLAGCNGRVSPPANVRDAALVTPDRRVRIPEPKGEGFRCRQERYGPEDARMWTVSIVSCQLDTPGGSLLLEARDDAAPTLREAATAEEHCTKRLPDSYRGPFHQVLVAGERPITHQGRLGCEVIIEKKDESETSLRSIHRVVVSGGHVLYVSASAPPALFEVRRADIERWLSSASFAELNTASGPDVSGACGARTSGGP